MPSSPNFFHCRPSPPSASRRSTVLIVSCLLIGITGFISGLAGFLHSPPVYRCINNNNNSPPRSVRVVCETSTNSDSNNEVGEQKRKHKAMGFVGIQTGLEESTGLAFRFVIGRTNAKWKMVKLKKEVEEYDDFLQLDIQEQYSKLSYRTLAFFKAAYALFDCEFYVKADDGIY